MKLSAILEPLVAAGVDSETLLKTVRAYENQQEDALEKRRSADRDRQARKREKDGSSRDVTLRHSDSQPSRSRARGEDNLQTKNSTGQEEKKDAPPAPSPVSELRSVLDAEHAKAVVDHRQRLRKPLTAYAAKQLAAKFAKFPDPNAAADKMIESGWLKIEPDWGQAPTPRATAPPPKQTVGQQARDELRRMGLLGNATDDENRHGHQGDGSADFASHGIARRFAIASSR